jgi:hypothetical protein
MSTPGDRCSGRCPLQHTAIGNVLLLHVVQICEGRLAVPRPALTSPRRAPQHLVPLTVCALFTCPAAPKRALLHQVPRSTLPEGIITLWFSLAVRPAAHRGLSSVCCGHWTRVPTRYLLVQMIFAWEFGCCERPARHQIFEQCRLLYYLRWWSKRRTALAFRPIKIDKASEVTVAHQSLREEHDPENRMRVSGQARCAGLWRPEQTATPLRLACVQRRGSSVWMASLVLEDVVERLEAL